MLKTWTLYSISLISTFIFFLFYKMWVSWYCLIVLMVLPFLALIVTVIASQTVNFSIDNPSASVKGKPAFIKLTIKGIASVFSFYKIKMISTDHMTGEVDKKVIVICDNGVTKIPLDTKHCGAYSFKLSKLKVYDLLGFFHFDLNVNKDIEFLVKPSPEMPGYMPDMFGFKAKNLRKSNKPNSEIYDIRDYQAGDPVKSIHWKMSAKKDKYLVKEPLEEYGGYSRVILQMTDDRDELDLHLGQILCLQVCYPLVNPRSGLSACCIFKFPLIELLKICHDNLPFPPDTYLFQTLLIYGRSKKNPQKSSPR